MYSFHKVRGREEECVYQHKFFRKGKAELLPLIKKQKNQADVVDQDLLRLNETILEIKQAQVIIESTKVDTSSLDALMKLKQRLSEHVHNVLRMMDQTCEFLDKKINEPEDKP